MNRRSILARQWTLLLVAGVLYTALAIYATSSDTGVAGWINAAQARSGGTYSRKVTLMVLLFASLVPLVPLWLYLWPKDAPPAEPNAAAPKPGSRLLRAAVAFVVADAVVWAGAFAWGAWQANRENVDATATYTPLTLAAATPLHVAEGDHLSLRGRLLGEHVVTRSEGQYSKKMALVPVVEPSWKEGDPVHLLLSIGRDMSYVVSQALTSNDGALLVRVEGAPPAPALDVFSRMKAPIADDARTLAFVPSAEGRAKVVPQDEHNSLVVNALGGVGTACVLIVCVFYSVMPALVRRAERQRLAREARLAARRR